jgi:small ligand-binding sensory domain FIST
VGLGEPHPTTCADRSVVLELAGRPTVVQELVEHLDAAGLDGHVRVLRVHDAVDA